MAFLDFFGARKFFVPAPSATVAHPLALLRASLEIPHYAGPRQGGLRFANPRYRDAAGSAELAVPLSWTGVCILPKSKRAMARLCTSSGPSAKRSVRIEA